MSRLGEMSRLRLRPHYSYLTQINSARCTCLTYMLMLHESCTHHAMTAVGLTQQ